MFFFEVFLYNIKQLDTKVNEANDIPYENDGLSKAAAFLVS